MQIQISAKNLELTEPLREHTEKKLALLEKLGHKILKIEAQLEKLEHHRKGRVYRFEVMVFLHKEIVRAEVESESMQEAIDLSIPKLQKQIKKHSERERQVDRNLLRRLGTVFNPFLRRSGDATEGIPFSIARRKTHTPETLNEVEAVERLQHDKLQFLIYNDREAKQLMMVYRLSDSDRLGHMTIAPVTDAAKQ